MSDIFISYANEDHDRVLPLVSALEKAGWSLFWDKYIPAGRTWRRIIGSEIQACRSVLVVWTKTSITSEWVLEEAETGKRRRILIPVLLDDVEPPFGFGNIQAANLAAWKGDTTSPTFSRLVADIANIVGTAPTEERVRQLVRKRSEPQAQPKAEEENQRRIDQEANRARLRLAPKDVSVFERLAGSDRRRLYAGGVVIVVIGLAVMAFWLFFPFGSKDADVNNTAQVATKVQEHIKTAGAYHDRGEYSTALAELAKAKSLDPSNKAVQAELERTKKACLAEQRIVLTSLRCD
jgi:TIR domain